MASFKHSCCVSFWIVIRRKAARKILMASDGKKKA
jgi:hypothetical protein